MSRAGKVKVVVKSRRVPVRTVEFTTYPILPVSTFATRVNSWSPPARRKRVVVYESVLDEEQRRAIDEGHRIACSLGLDLEVVDKSKLSFFGRVLSSFGSGSSGTPNVVVSPSNRGTTESLTDSDLMPTEAV